MHYTRALLIGRAEAQGGRKRYKFRASTTQPARDGFVIPAEEWRLDNFKANPVVLLGHDYASLPIGRAVSIATDDDGLVAEVEYDDDDPVAQSVMRKLDNDMLHAVSVGFRPGRIEWPEERAAPGIFRDVDLLEISNVAVPSDPQALQMHAARGMAPGVAPSPELTALYDRLALVEERLARLQPSAPELEPDVDTVLADYPTLRRFTA